MEIAWLNNIDPRPTDEPLMALISIDGTHAYASTLDEGFEHSVLLRTITGSDSDFENYFRIIINVEGADWTFVCPTTYRNIANKEKRIKRFYEDGYIEIKNFLKEIGYPEYIDIPTRYRRHYNYLTNNDF